ncbi:MAG: Na/Pi cotransporter family protein [Clostridia bacterium]|nr:Na/Pi cotransporter family protein [Clostridia bacterium]
MSPASPRDAIISVRKRRGTCIIMGISTVFTFVGGLSLFLFGMTVMGDALRVLAGGKPRALIGKLCKTPVRGVLLGAAVTALVQSSSATTVMVIGFVNSGIMTLGQSVGVIMGANLGTTVTSWLLALTGASGSFLRFLNPSFFSPLLAIAGIVLIMKKSGDNRRQLGYVFLGFTVLIFGMETMSGAVEPLAELPEFVSLLTAFSRPIPGFLAGALLTALIQSSSASIGILGALSASGAITVGGSIPIILGQNVGTCITTLLSGVGASKNARRAAFVHLYFNLIGAVVQMGIFLAVSAVRPPAILSRPADVTTIALVHTLFNIISLTIMLPFTRALERLALFTVRDNAPLRPAPAASGSSEDPDVDNKVKTGFDNCRLLDDRFLVMPSFALTMCRAAVARMSELCRESLRLLSYELEGDGSGGKDEKNAAARLDELRGLIAGYAAGITDYLTRLAGGRIRLGKRETELLTHLLAAAGELRRIGELTAEAADAVNADKTNAENAAVSGGDRDDIARLAREAEEMILIAFAVFSGENDTGSKLLPEGKRSGSDLFGDSGPRVAAEIAGDAAGAAASMRRERIERLAAGNEDPHTAAALDTVTVALEHIVGHALRLAEMKV